MSRTTRRIISLLPTILLVLVVLFAPTSAMAQTKAWSDVCVDDKNPDVATLQGIQCLMGNIFTVSLPMLGMTSFVMMIVGSFRWMLSGGNTQAVEKARGTWTFAAFAIVAGLSGFIILNLLSDFTGVKLGQFLIPSSDTQWQ